MSETLKNDKIFLDFVKHHASLARFVFTGTLNTIVDFVLFALFANILAINPIISNIMSTGITLCFSYFMNHYFVFKSNKRKRETAALFIAITLFNVWVIQSSIIWITLHIIGPMAFFQNHAWTLNLSAKLCGVAISMVLNYLGYRIIFRRSYDKEEKN